MSSTVEVHIQALSDGKKNGQCIDWTDDKNYTISNYHDDQLHGSMLVVSNGITIESSQWSEGVKHGLYATWSTNGAPDWSVNYCHGEWHGEYKQWWPRGAAAVPSSVTPAALTTVDRLAIHSSYVDGQPHGEFKTWTYEGKLDSYYMYNKGVVVRDLLPELDGSNSDSGSNGVSLSAGSSVKSSVDDRLNKLTNHHSSKITTRLPAWFGRRSKETSGGAVQLA